MKIIFLFLIILFTVLMNDAWCQQQLPSGPGDTLRRSQDTMEFYKLERKMQKDRQRLKEKKDESEGKPGCQKDIEINKNDNDVIQYSDQEKTENE